MFVDSDFTYGWRLLLVLIGFILGTQALLAQDAQIQLENELLLDLRLDGERLGLDILGYQRGDDFLLSLDELTSGLGFPITVDSERGSASGWYISEDRIFSLDIGNGTVVSGENRWPIATGEAVMFQGGLYVETNAIQKWFPVQLSAVIRELYLDVKPSETLPIQRRFNRRERVLAPASGYQEPQYPLQENPYRFFSPHITKLRIGQSTVRQAPESAAEYGTNYASLSRGDLGWMTSTLSLAGQSGESLLGARLKLERTAFEGPIGLNHLEIGDVDAGGYRGLLLRGGIGGSIAKGGRFDNESVTIEGSQLPDWDVELYQNGQLILIQTTGNQGRYLFEDVPLLFGRNRFELKFFGPNGEIDSREEFHFLGAGMLEPGRLTYQMSAVQSGRTVFGVNDIDGEGDRDSAVYDSNVNLGLSRNITVGAGIRSLERNGERLAFNTASLGLSTSRAFASVRYFDTPESQNSVGTSLRTRIGDTSLNLGYTRFFDDTDLASSPLKWQGNVDVTSSIVAVPIKLEISTNEQEDSTSYDAVIGTTASLPGAGRFATSLWYNSVEERLDGNTTTASFSGGQSSFHTSIDPWNFRLSTSYSFGPETELLDLSADSRLRIDRDLSLDLSLRRNPITDTTYYGGGINWQLEKVAINARVSYDSDERWGGLITLTTALVHQPGTLMPILDSSASVDAGSVEVRVYENAKGNEITPVADVGVNGVQVWRHATTNENGVAYLSRMSPHRQIDIELDESTLADSELRSSNPGVSIVSRPGSYAVVEFPIVRTAELEGHVVVAVGDDKQPVSRALVILRTTDGDVVAQTRTAFDGFYLFDGIEPGDYSISLEEPLARRIHKRPENITVLSRSGVIGALDFTLRPVRGKTISKQGLSLEQL